MLTHNKLLIDKNCPMCQLYGDGFKKLNLIDDNTIENYQDVSQDVLNDLDAERAKSEVALYNVKTGTTIYGHNAFLTILAGKSKIAKWVLFSKPVQLIAKQLYKLITYNRHLIAGVQQQATDRDCTPAMNLPYRWAYIILVAILTGIILNQYTILLDQQLGVQHYSWREAVVCFGQIGWQFIAISLINPSRRMDYLGNMSTVSMIGGIMILPLFVINAFYPLEASALLIYFSFVVMIMLNLHIKRSKKLGLGLSITFSWVLYRSLLLMGILLTIIL